MSNTAKTAERLITTVQVATLIVACACIWGCSNSGSEPSAGGDAGETLTIGVMPKLVGIDFFNAVETGALEAGKELGVTVVYDGPVVNDVTKQSALVESWIARKFDAVAIAPNDPDAIAPVLRKAQQRGIAVVTYDADADKAARDCFVNQCTYAAVAETLVDLMAEAIGPEGKYIFLTGSLTAVNQNIWMEHMERYRQQKYPGMTNLSETPKVSEEDQALATQVTIDILKGYPDIDGIYAMTSVALPGAAEALRKEKAFDRVFLTGLSTPNSMRQYVRQGVVKKFVLWNPVDLGYLAVHAAKGVVDGSITETTASITAGRLGKIQIADRELLLGDPMIFHAGNIDEFDF